MSDPQRLRQRNDELTRRANQLADRVDTLEREKEDLRYDKEELEDKIHRLRDEIESLEETAQQRREELQQYQHEFHELRESTHQMQHRVEKTLEDVLTRTEALPTRVLKTIFMEMCLEEGLVEVQEVASHPSADPKLWRWMVQQAPERAASAVARIRQALQAEPVRQALLARSKDPSHWAQCCRFAEGGQFELAFRKTLEAAPEKLLEVLGDHPSVAQKTSPDVLRTLLEHDQASVRRKALRLFKHLDAPTPTPEGPSR